MITNRYQSSTTQLHFCNNAVQNVSSFWSTIFFQLDLNHLQFRNGGGDEERGLPGRGAHRGGEESAVGRLQERDRRAQGLLEDRLLHRAEGGEQGGRGQAEAHQDLQREGACTAYSEKLAAKLIYQICLSCP